MKNVIIKSIIAELRETKMMVNLEASKTEEIQKAIGFKDNGYVDRLRQTAHVCDLVAKAIERRYIDFCSELKIIGGAVETSELAMSIVRDTIAYFESFFMMDKEPNSFNKDVKLYAVELLNEMLNEILDEQELCDCPQLDSDDEITVRIIIRLE